MTVVATAAVSGVRRAWSGVATGATTVFAVKALEQEQAYLATSALRLPGRMDDAWGSLQLGNLRRWAKNVFNKNLLQLQRRAWLLRCKGAPEFIAEDSCRPEKWHPSGKIAL